MTVFSLPDDSPPDFQRATAGLPLVDVRPEITLESVPAPKKMAPYGLVVEAYLAIGHEDVGSGRFCILHDPTGDDAWDGVLRMVTLTQVDLEPEMGEDPLLGEVGWTWLLEALDASDAPHHKLGGTVTRVADQSFGELASTESSLSMEIRASWTPTTLNVAPHFQAWLQFLCQAAGLPPVPAGVTALPRRIR